MLLGSDCESMVGKPMARSTSAFRIIMLGASVMYVWLLQWLGPSKQFASLVEE